MTSAYENFGHWLRFWRRRFELTQEDVGNAVGVSKQHISNLERGQQFLPSGAQARASIEVIDKLAKLFNRPISEARNIAGYGVGEEVKPQEVHNVLNQIQQDLAEMNRLFLGLPAEKRADVLAVVRTLHKQWAKEGEKEIGSQTAKSLPIVDDDEVTESDARPIKPGKG